LLINTILPELHLVGLLYIIDLIKSLLIPSQFRVFLVTFFLPEKPFKSQQQLYTITSDLILRTMHVVHRANLSVPRSFQINNNYFALSLTLVLDNYVFSVRQ